MFLDEEKLIDLLIKHQLNVNQMHFMYLIHSGSSSLYRIAQEGKKFYRSEIDDLVTRGFIENFNNTRSAIEDHYVIRTQTPEGKDILEYLNDDVTMGDELWTVYPWSFMIGEKNVPAKTCDRDEITELYVKKIKGSTKKHREIIKVIKRGTALNMISVGIEKFVRGEQWEFLIGELDKMSSQKLFGTDEFK